MNHRKRKQRDWVDDVVDSGITGHKPRGKFAVKRGRKQKPPFDCYKCDSKRSVVLGFGGEDLVCLKCTQRWSA